MAMINPVRMTVGMPVRRGTWITELALYGLSRQLRPNVPWELIVYKDGGVGKSFTHGHVQNYVERLRRAGCVDVKYLAADCWVPLAHKWNAMAHIAEDTSQVFLLQGDDDYSPSNRLDVTWESMDGTTTDWLSNERCPFVNLPSFEIRMFEAEKTGAPHNIGPNIAVRTKMLRRMMPLARMTGNDGHILTSLYPMIRQFEWIDHGNGFCTHGQNMLSKRGLWFGAESMFPRYVRHVTDDERERIDQEALRWLEAKVEEHVDDAVEANV